MDGVQLDGNSQIQDKNLVVSSIISPVKIPILILIKIYCSGKLPANLSPPVLSLLVKLIENPHELIETKNTDSMYKSLEEVLELISYSINLYSKQRNQIKKIGLLKNPNQATTDETDDQTKNNLENENITVLKRYVLHEIWKMKSLDSLHDFFTALRKFLIIHPKDKERMNKGKISKVLTPTSFLGSFINTILLGFKALNFDELVVLWGSFSIYRESTRAQSTSLGISVPDKDSATDSENFIQRLMVENSGVLGNNTKIELISKLDLSELLEYQLVMLEKFGESVPESIQNVLNLMAQNHYPTTPSSYYIEFLKNWKMSDYDASFDSLHKYFDYMMSNKQKLYYHYALLSLAALHASFNCEDEALRAIDEAISVARENKDLDCLNYLLTWLFNYLKDKNYIYSQAKRLSRSQILQFLKLKTKENRNYILQSISYQFQAYQQIQDGAPLRKILENITRASYMSFNDENVSSSSNISTTFTNNCQLQSSLWSRVGIPALADAMIDVILDQKDMKITLKDKLELIMRKAYLEYDHGNIDEAFELFNKHKNSIQDNLILLRIWESRELLLRVKSFLNRNRLRVVSILLGKLNSNLGIITDIELYYEIKYQESTYFKTIGDFEKSQKIVSDCILKMKSDDYSYNNFWYFEFQLLYVDITINSSASPVRVLSLLLNTLKHAFSCSMTTIVAKGSLLLVELLVTANPKSSLEDAKSILMQIMPMILQIQELESISKANLLLAKVLNSELYNTENISEIISNPHAKEKVNTILELLETSITGFKKMNNLKLMKEAFELEYSLAEITNHEGLGSHSKEALQQISKRINEESQYGF